MMKRKRNYTAMLLSLLQATDKAKDEEAGSEIEVELRNLVETQNEIRRNAGTASGLATRSMSAGSRRKLMRNVEKEPREELLRQV